MPTEFTPLSALAGGALIGLATALLLLANGRIAGISGILGGAAGPADANTGWRVAFIAGLLLGALAVTRLAPATGEVALQASIPILIVGGLLVGIGTRLGNGCTSGHGVCGLARGSRRSIVATAVFFAVALLTVFIVRHVVGG
jgi:hypothetical protein